VVGYNISHFCKIHVQHNVFLTFCFVVFVGFFVISSLGLVHEAA